MNILALDLNEPTGWALRRAGAALTSGERSHTDRDDADRDLCYRQGLRLRRFRAWLSELVAPANTGGDAHVDFVAYEAPILFAGRPGSSIAAYQYEGVLLAELATLAIPHRAVNNATLKKHATGNGHAKKPEMRAAALKRWGMPASGELGQDQADALCVLAWALDELGER